MSVSSHIPCLLVRMWPLTLSSYFPEWWTLLGALPWHCPWNVLSIWALARARVSFAFWLIEICWITTDTAGGAEISWIIPALLSLLKVPEVCSICKGELISLAGYPEYSSISPEAVSFAGLAEVCSIDLDLVFITGCPEGLGLFSLAGCSEVCLIGRNLLSLSGCPEVLVTSVSCNQR